MAARRKSPKQTALDLEGQSDPRAPLDSKKLLAAAQPVLKQLAEDLLERAKASKAVTAALEARHQAEQAQRRTADPFVVWQTNLVDQVAAAWLLSCVFVRTLEDRGLLGGARLAGPGAADSQRQFLDLAPSLGERDYLLTVFRELSRFPAARDLFDAKHNPVWLLTPSAEAAKALLGLFREPSPEAPTFRFGQDDTRFLGDLYQDLNEVVQNRYALLQTPRFVESFILDRTLERAIERFGLNETTLIDPTCGSGHFLLGAFDRLYEHRLHAEPGLGEREAARKALDAVYGSDINPYAIAIARFRLTLAFLDKARFKKLEGAPTLPLHVVVADSLLHNAQLAQASFQELEGQSAQAWAGDAFALEDEGAAREVLYRRYATVVGNPPYITVKDTVLRERYREMYRKSAAGKYSLGAPFTQRFFELARDGGSVGMITANSFMKREFGKKLIEEYLPSVNLDLIINTSGAYIPGHGTPTVLLFGTAEAKNGTDVLATLAKRGEPTTPEDPEQGLVWRSIADHWSDLGFENEYVSVARIQRSTLEKHPWSLGGGGAAELKEMVEERTAKRLGDIADSIGIASFTLEDDVYLRPTAAWLRLSVSTARIRVMVVGEAIRDWSIGDIDGAFFPYDDVFRPMMPHDPSLAALWAYRTNLSNSMLFGGKTKVQGGLKWYEFGRLTIDKLRTSLTITFAFVATHNHFVLDRGGKVFNRTAPVIKLPVTATEDDHLALLAYLNSSTVAFFFRQAGHSKGAQGINEGHKAEVWEQFLEYSATLVGSCPVLRELRQFAPLARHMVDDAASREACMPAHRISEYAPGGERSLADHLADSSQLAGYTLAGMVSLQEELDWLVYEAFDLLTADDLALLRRAREEALPGFPTRINMRPEEIHRHGLFPGHRPFEIVLARDALVSGTKTAWFSRNDYRSPSEIKDTYAPSYQRLLDARVQIIDRNPQIRLLEQPEFKRRWTLRDFAAETREAARALVFGVVEAQIQANVEPARARALSASTLGEAKARDVAALLFPEDATKGVANLMGEQAVPFLAAYRYTDTGLDKRAVWEQTWELQRREDVGEKVGAIPVPPRYDSKDYREATSWSLRGKLDVPKERFISYPGCESDQDHEPVYGWAGWNHLQQAQALAALYQKRKQEEAWGKDRLTPMLAGLLELIPWIKQWHNEPSEEYAGMRLGDFFDAFLDSECRSLGLTRDDLRAWRPETRVRRKERAMPARREKPAEVFAFRPVLENAYEEGLFVLSALVRARGGKIDRVEAARAFILLFQPDLLAARALRSVRARVKAWLLQAKDRSLPPSLFTSMERDLLNAGRLRRHAGPSAGKLSLLATEHTWSKELVTWYLPEAELALDVVEALREDEWATVGSSLAPEDRDAVEGRAVG